MSRERAVWVEAKAVFGRLLDLPDSERDAALRGLVGSDPDVAREVRALLASHREQAEDHVDLLLGVVDEALRPPDPGDDRLGDHVDGLIVTELLGRGGMGSVYAAVPESGGEPVAIKFVRVEGDRGQLQRRFAREQAGLRRLEHANICTIHSSGVAPDGTPFFTMDYVDGVPIDEALDSRCATVPARLTLLAEVCDTLAYAHSAGVIHRDLKPSNILVRRDGSHVLLDFGIAKILDEQWSGEPTTLTLAAKAFTPFFASPEQLDGLAVSPASDVFSLGVLAYVLSSGRLPVFNHDGTSFDTQRPDEDGSLARTAFTRGVTVDQLSRILDGRLQRVLRRATALEAGRRTKTAEHFASELRRWTASREGQVEGWFRRILARLGP